MTIAALLTDHLVVSPDHQDINARHSLPTRMKISWTMPYELARVHQSMQSLPHSEQSELQPKFWQQQKCSETKSKTKRQIKMYTTALCARLRCAESVRARQREGDGEAERERASEVNVSYVYSIWEFVLKFIVAVRSTKKQYAEL